MAGGVLGGALSGVLAYDVLWLMRLAVGLVLLAWSAVWWLLRAIPAALYRLALVVGMVVGGTVQAVIQSVRSL